MKTKLAAAALLLASTSLSFAADLAVKAPYAPAAVWSWTGFYLGGNVGAGWGTTESTLASVNGALGAVPVGTALAQNSRSGFLGGGQLGYNWQSGWVVFGVQGDISGLDVKGSTTCVGFVTCTTKSDWLATVTGRIGGVVADRTLVYAKGGAAWMHTNDSIGVPGVFESRFEFDAARLGARPRRRICLRPQLERLHRIQLHRVRQEDRRLGFVTAGGCHDDCERRHQEQAVDRQDRRELQVRRPGRRALLIF